nr:DUF1016 N-terminal domain-containing protein [Arthrobacter cavernae]
MEPMTEPRGLSLPTGYSELLGDLKGQVRTARAKALRTVNTQLIELYWSIGPPRPGPAGTARLGSGVIKRLAEDPRAEFPDMKGFSARNLQYMTTFARTWEAGPVAQQLLRNCRGATSWCSWTRSRSKNPGTGTRPPPSNTAGPGTCCCT